MTWGESAQTSSLGRGPEQVSLLHPLSTGGATGRRLLQAVLGTLVLLGGRWRAVAGLEQKSLEI